MMMRACPLLLASVACSAALLFGCSQSRGASDGPIAAPTPERVGVVLAQVVTNDARVTLVGGAPQLRVVVRTLDGAIVADGLTFSELEARNPALYQIVTSSYAHAAPSSTTPSGTYVDATLDLARTTEETGRYSFGRGYRTP